MTTTWKNELNVNRGFIYTPDGNWVEPILPLLRTWEGDVWCDAKEEIESPSYDQGLARFIESVVAAGFCGLSGTARFNFVLQNVSLDRAKGDHFDWNRVFIDREILKKTAKKVGTRRLLHQPFGDICDTFGEAPRRGMNHLKTRVDLPRQNTLQERVLEKICWLSLARKVFLARAGHPEFCERYVS